MKDLFLKNIGKLLGLVFLVVLAVFILKLIGFDIVQVIVGPFVLERNTPTPSAIIQRTITPTNTLIESTSVPGHQAPYPICVEYLVRGNGEVEACNDFIRIKAEDETTVYKHDVPFQNLYVDLNVDILNLDVGGIYSVVLRQANDCRGYKFKFLKVNDFNLKIELYKHICNSPSELLNQSGSVSITPNQPHKLSVSIEGAQEVIFSVKINNTEILKAKDTRGFIWSGNFGVSVENGEVEFTEIKLSEQ